MEPPLDRSTTWPYVDGEPGPYHYARNAHPVGVEAERALGELEGGDALLFSSGMGAETALVLALLSPGSTIALAEDAYYGTGVLFGELERWGLQHVLFDQTGPPPRGRRPRLDRGTVESAADDARLRSGGGAPGSRRLRRDSGDAGAPTAARARLRPRAPLGDQVPRGPSRRAPRRRRLQARGACRPPARAPDAHRDRRGARRRVAAGARAEDARGSRQPSEPDGEDPRRAAGGARTGAQR